MGAPELAAFYCAMTGERWDSREVQEPGTGEWFRPIEWFWGKYRDDERTSYPFSERTIRTGLQRLDEHGQLLRRWATRHQAKRFDRPRVMYRNAFAKTGALIISFEAEASKRSAR